MNVSGLSPLLPNTFLAETPLSTPSSDPQVRLHLLVEQSNKLLQSVIVLLLPFVREHFSTRTTWHQTARVYSARPRASRHAVTSPPDVDHAYQRIMLRTDTDTLLLFPARTLCHTSLLSSLACRSLSFLLLGSDSRHTCRFATRAFTNPSVLVAKPDTLVSSRLTHSEPCPERRLRPQRRTLRSRMPIRLADLRTHLIQVSTRGQGHCVTSTPPAVILIILLPSVDATILSLKGEHSVAGSIARGTDAFGKQEVLDRFVRVQGNNVENCWADQGNTTGEAQRERIGVESKMEYAHFLNDDRK